MYTTDLYEMYTGREHGLEINRIPLRIYRRKHSNEAPVPLHSHNFWEIIVVLSGSATHIVCLPDCDPIEYPISAGDICAIAPGEKHAFSFKGNQQIEIINLLFSPLVVQRGDSTNWDGMSAFDFIHSYPYIPSMRRAQFQIVLSPEELRDTCRIIECIEKELKNKELGYNTMAQLYFSLILTKFMRVYYSQTEGLLDRSAGCVQMAVQYIGQNFKKKISLEMLAEYTHFSVRSLTRKFKADMNMSVSEYILQQRISNAKTILQSTTQKIEDIALDNGFTSVSYFCNQFKKAEGITPQEYRNLNFLDLPYEQEPTPANSCKTQGR